MSATGRPEREYRSAKREGTPVRATGRPEREYRSAKREGTPVGVPPAEARGRCMCGRVRFVARFPSRFACHCHCESCRRAHSAGFVTWIGFPSTQVTIEAGSDDLAAYESSPGTKRSFCRACGTRLFFQSDRWAGETHVALAAFDDPVDRAPDRHAFFEEHVGWIPWPDAGGP